MELNIGPNVVTFKHFTEKPNGDWRRWSANLYYLPKFIEYPSLAINNRLININSESELYGDYFFFLISQRKMEKSVFRNDPYHFFFLINEELADNEEPKSLCNVFEIRVKNYDNEWQDWQAICSDTITVFRGEKHDDLTYLRSPITDELSDLKEKFEIRYSGQLWISDVTGQRQIVTDRDMLLNINPFDNRITPFTDLGNPCYPFDDRTADLKRFEEKYYRYDSDGKRI